jgi:hypothetical protein
MDTRTSHPMVKRKSRSNVVASPFLCDGVLDNIVSFLLTPAQQTIAHPDHSHNPDPHCGGRNSYKHRVLGASTPLNVRLASRRFHNVSLQAVRKASSSSGVPLVEFPRSVLRPIATSDVRGGGTGGEYVDNIKVDGALRWNKWFSVGALPVEVGYEINQSGWYEINQSIVLHPLAAYALRFASDCPHRDPISWQVLDMVPGRSRAQDRIVHTVELAEDALHIDRYEWRLFRLPQATNLHNGFTLRINRSRGGGNECQLCQIVLLAPVDISRFEK